MHSRTRNPRVRGTGAGRDLWVTEAFTKAMLGPLGLEQKSSSLGKGGRFRILHTLTQWFETRDPEDEETDEPRFRRTRIGQRNVRVMIETTA